MLGFAKRIACKQFVNIGCGRNYHHDWDNYDLHPVSPEIRKIDLSKPLEIPDGQYHAVYCSHVLEHLSRSKAPGVLAEFARILMQGGVCRMVVPDLELICRHYLTELDAVVAGDDNASALHEWMTVELLDQMTRTISGGFMGRLWWSRPLMARELIIRRLGEEAGKWLNEIDSQIQKGAKPLTRQDIYQTLKPKEKEIVTFREQGEIHQWMYDRVSLKRLLEEAGFQSVKVCGATESAIPNFSSYNLDTDENGNVRKPDSLFMEGIK